MSRRMHFKTGDSASREFSAYLFATRGERGCVDRDRVRDCLDLFLGVLDAEAAVERRKASK